MLKTQDKALGELLGQQAEILYTDQSHLGMGHSLAAGFTDLKLAMGPFVGLLDMPFLQAATLEHIALRATTTTHRIIRPVFARDAGSASTTSPTKALDYQGPPKATPIGIHNSLFAQVRKSSGDQGAKWLLKEHASSIDDIAVSDAGVFMDIDQPKDLLAATLVVQSDSERECKLLMKDASWRARCALVCLLVCTLATQATGPVQLAATRLIKNYALKGKAGAGPMDICG